MIVKTCVLLLCVWKMSFLKSSHICTSTIQHMHIHTNSIKQKRQIVSVCSYSCDSENLCLVVCVEDGFSQIQSHLCIHHQTHLYIRTSTIQCMYTYMYTYHFFKGMLIFSCHTLYFKPINFNHIANSSVDFADSCCCIRMTKQVFLDFMPFS